MTIVTGVDEAGRGALAGPVYAAAVSIEVSQVPGGVGDSKQLSKVMRGRLFDEITAAATSYAIASASVAEITEINILQASLLAMSRAVHLLATPPQHVFVDGNQLPKWHYPSTSVIGGDKKIAAISCASILAKVARDGYMTELDKEFPGYGFAQHKGYGTKKHLQALATLGPSAVHRPTFAPVAHYTTSILQHHPTATATFAK